MQTLETAIVLAVVLALVTFTLQLAPPLYQEVRQAARLDVLATVVGMDSARLYQADRIRLGPDEITALQVSPQRVLELTALLRDTIHLFRTWLGGS
ncbi:MAG: hypothetical protein GX112_03760 [Clostridiaceae bacterium]|nr:hypothetical protein [Clostridiaceae bacterium]